MSIVVYTIAINNFASCSYSRLEAEGAPGKNFLAKVPHVSSTQSTDALDADETEGF